MFLFGLIKCAICHVATKHFLAFTKKMMFSIWSLFVWVLFHCYTPACSALGGDNNKNQAEAVQMGFIRREAGLTLFDRLVPAVSPSRASLGMARREETFGADPGNSRSI